MATIKEMKAIPLKDLVIDKAQVRLRDVNKGISELAESIAKTGLLEPIVVAPTDTEGVYEIITGQRRFLAHQQLKRQTILAAILDEKIDEREAKVLSLTENLMRQDLNRRDLIDVCTYLFKKYGTIRDVALETGLPQNRVSQYVKFERLIPQLKELVDSGDVNIDAALKAQDAAGVTGNIDAEEAVNIAHQISPMSGTQRKSILKEVESNPSKPIDDVIEHAKSGGKIIQTIVSLGPDAHSALQTYANHEGVNQDDAAAELISDGLSTKGYLG